MTQPGESGSRQLVEVQLSEASGAILADGRFVVEMKDGLGRVLEPLRSLRSVSDYYRIDIRISELLLRSERDELEELRRIVRQPKEVTDGE